MMEYAEDEYLMLSGIQHFAFCRRQWALIHIEQQWDENIHTVAGELMHEKAHDPYLKEKRKDTIISRSMPIYSRYIGISGNCDVVEFHRSENGVSLHGHRGFFDIFPVEYKKGKPKDSNIDVLQLMAEAMCLEEMLITNIQEGALYYGEIRRRENIFFTDSLRNQVKEMFYEMHEIFNKKYTPKVKWSKKCNGCSLKDICLPRLGKVNSVASYIDKNIKGEFIE